MQPNRWVESLALDPDTKVFFVGKSKSGVFGFGSVDTRKELNGLRTIKIGDVVEGIRIGAIRCKFHPRDAGRGAAQFMWRGRWQCMAGRSAQEIDNAVGQDGIVHFDYIVVSPVSISE